MSKSRNKGQGQKKNRKKGQKNNQAKSRDHQFLADTPTQPDVEQVSQPDRELLLEFVLALIAASLTFVVLFFTKPSGPMLAVFSIIGAAMFTSARHHPLPLIAGPGFGVLYGLAIFLILIRAKAIEQWMQHPAFATEAELMVRIFLSALAVAVLARIAGHEEVIVPFASATIDFLQNKWVALVLAFLVSLATFFIGVDAAGNFLTRATVALTSLGFAFGSGAAIGHAFGSPFAKAFAKRIDRRADDRALSAGKP